MTAPPRSPRASAGAVDRGGPPDARLPPAVRRSALAAGALVGGVVGTAIGVVALVRRDRPMHAVGRTFHARVEPVLDAQPSGVLWIDTLGPRDVLVRFSRGAGLPPWAPDVQGIAVRLPEHRGHTDLLFSSTGLRGPGRFVLVPRRSALAGPASSLMPFRGPDGPLLLAITPVPDEHDRPPASATTPTTARTPPSPTTPTAPTTADGDVAPGAPSLTGTRWRLLWSRASGPWSAFAELVVGRDAGPAVDRATRFDPLGATPPDLRSYRWAAVLRSPAYRLARLLGRRTGPT